MAGQTTAIAPLLEYLTTTKIGEKGQLTVPKQFREDLGLETGAPFAVLRLGDGLILLPEQKRFDQLCEQISASLTAGGVTAEAVLATLPETRQRVYERRYGVTAATSVDPKTAKSRAK
jgi:AbrB family looped-hinge helix DNA binding protein